MLRAITAGLAVLLLFASCDNNNFGSSEQDSDASGRIYLGDSHIQEWSVVTGFHNPATGDFDDYVNYALEGYYEPTDLTINRGDRNSIQDVRFVPVDWIDADPGTVTYAITSCDTSGAAVYGAHNRRVCDKKIIVVNMFAWYGLAGGDRIYVAGHEFGHAVGLRHSNAGPGIANDGTYVDRIHDDPSHSVMATGQAAFNGSGLTNGDVDRINANY